MPENKPIDKESVDLAQKLKEALLGSQKGMKELSAMASAYGKSLGVASEEINKATVDREKEIRLVDVLHSKMQRVGEESKRGMQLQNLSNQISETANDLASEQNKLMADLVLKQTMIQTGLEGSFAEQAKNYKLLLDQGEITEELYNSAVKRLQEEQHFNHELKDQLELQESIAESILEIKEEAEAWKKSFTKIFETAKAIGRDPAILGAFMMKEGIEKLEKAHESFETLRESGLSSGQAIEAQFKGLSISSMLGLSDTKGVMEGVVQEFGNVNALSSETVNELGTMAHHLGISGQEALKLNASLSQLPGETSETAAAAMEHTAHLAEAQGIAGSKVFGDMAKNTGAMALYSKGGAEGFGKAAVALHKMGVEIATAAKMADGLLDFESSINKQMEASVLLGKEINLDKARELALNGDLAGSTAEVLKNIGGSAEFDKMNVLQKKALAEATGMSVEELQKSIDAQEESNKYFGEGASLGARAAGTLMEYGGAAAGFFKENGMLLMASIQFMSQFGLLQKLSNGLTAVGNFLMSNRHVAEIGHWAKQRAQWVAEKAHDMWKAGAAKLGFASKAKDMGGVGDKVKDLGGDKIAATADQTKNVKGDSGKGIFGFLKGLGDGLASIGQQFGKVVAGAAALGIAGLALAGGFALALNLVKDVDPVVMVTFAGSIGIFGGALALMGQLGGNVIKGALALGIVALSLIPAAFAFSLLKGVDTESIIAFSIALPLLALAAAGLGFLIVPIALGAIALASLGVGMIAVAGGLAVLQAAQGGIGIFQSMTELAAASSGLGLVGVSLMSIGAGLGMMAAGGFLALPIIGALIGLAAVAPALSGLMGGGGGGEEEDKMQVIADKLDQLISVASKGGDINMDGRKVGEIVRLGLNTSNVR